MKTEQSKENPHIMYVCQNCAENDPESCGHWNRNELRVTPDGEWMCDNCYEYGDFEYTKTLWHHLPIPPEYVEKT